MKGPGRVHALCVKRVFMHIQEVGAADGSDGEWDVGWKNELVRNMLMRPLGPSKFIGRFRSLVEWKSIPDTWTINGSENNKLGTRSPHVYERATSPRGVESIRDVPETSRWP